MGENILVAPVIKESAVTRDVYLPAGMWRDENNPDRDLIPGRTWLRSYPAKLNVLPWFTRVSPTTITKTVSSEGSIIRVLNTCCVLALGLIVYLFR